MLPLFAIKTCSFTHVGYTACTEQIEHRCTKSKEIYTHGDSVRTLVKIKSSTRRSLDWPHHDEYLVDIENELCLTGTVTEKDIGPFLEEYFLGITLVSGSQLLPDVPNREILSTSCVELISTTENACLVLETVSRCPFQNTVHEDPLEDIENSLPMTTHSAVYRPDNFDFTALCIVAMMQRNCRTGFYDLNELIPPKLSLESVVSTSARLYSAQELVSSLVTNKPFDSRNACPLRDSYSTTSEIVEDTLLVDSSLAPQCSPNKSWWEVLAISFIDCNTHSTRAPHAEELLPDLSASSSEAGDGTKRNYKRKRVSAQGWLDTKSPDAVQVQTQMLPFPPRRVLAGCNAGSTSAVERLIDLNSPWTFMPIPATRTNATINVSAQQMRDLPALLELAPVMVKPMVPRNRQLGLATLDLAEAVVKDLCDDAAVWSGHSGHSEQSNVTPLELFVQNASQPAVADEEFTPDHVAEREGDSLHLSLPVGTAALEVGITQQHAACISEEAAVAPDMEKEEEERQSEPAVALRCEVSQPLQGPPASPPSAGVSRPPETFPAMPPVFEFAFPSVPSENMVEQYLRLQSRDQPRTATIRSAVTPQRLQPQHARAHHQHTGTAHHNVSPPVQSQGVQPPAGVVQVTPERLKADQVQCRMTQLAAHNISPFHANEAPLMVLTSECFLDNYCRSVSLGTHGIELLDVPLQPPVSLIVDANTAICMLEQSVLVSKHDLRAFGKALTKATFKFSKIYIVVVLSEGEQQAAVNSALLSLCQATSHFPAIICIRQCASCGDSLTLLISQLCAQARRDALRALPSGADAKYAHRPFLDHLQHAGAKQLAHCEFLQLFPTVNYYVAALLLHHHPLRELTGQRARSLWDLLSTQYVLTEDLKERIKSFVALLEVHAGLTMAVD